MADAALSDEMTYLLQWGYTPGTPEAAAAWKEKQDFDAGKRTFDIPMFFGIKDICYDSPIDGRPITSMAARRDDLARSGCVEYDPEMRKDYTRRVEADEKRLEQSVDSLLEREIAAMPSRKQEKLAAELQSGVTADIVRQTA